MVHPSWNFRERSQSFLFFLKFYLHRSSTYILDKIMGGLLSNSGGEKDGLVPSWNGKGQRCLNFKFFRIWRRAMVLIGATTQQNW
jgi:hypothetical protein